LNARLFKHEGLAKLRAQCRRDPSIIAGYEESGTVPLEEEWLFQSSLVSTADEAPDLILESAVSQKAKAATDAENAIRIWEYLPDLRIHQATDERLWAWFCHGEFNEYCLWRVGRYRSRRE